MHLTVSFYIFARRKQSASSILSLILLCFERKQLEPEKARSASTEVGWIVERARNKRSRCSVRFFEHSYAAICFLMKRPSSQTSLLPSVACKIEASRSSSRDSDSLLTATSTSQSSTAHANENSTGEMHTNLRARHFQQFLDGSWHKIATKTLRNIFFKFLVFLEFLEKKASRNQEIFRSRNQEIS